MNKDELIEENKELKKELAIANHNVVMYDYHLANTVGLLDDMLSETAGFFDFYNDNEELVAKSSAAVNKYWTEMPHG